MPSDKGFLGIYVASPGGGPGFAVRHQEWRRRHVHPYTEIHQFYRGAAAEFVNFAFSPEGRSEHGREMDVYAAVLDEIRQLRLANERDPDPAYEVSEEVIEEPSNVGGRRQGLSDNSRVIQHGHNQGVADQNGFMKLVIAI